MSLESILAFQKVCQLVPPNVPTILQSRVDEAKINEEIRSALATLNPAGQLAVAGDGVESIEVLVEEPAFSPR